MLAYVLRRILQSIAVLLAVGLIAFGVSRYAGDPVESLLGQDATEAERIELVKSLGLGDPVYVQYGRFVANALRGEFGISYRQGRPVKDIISERLPATLELAFAASLIAVAGGIYLGIHAALRRDGLATNVMMAVTLVSISLPTFLIGILLIWLFSVELNWLPAFGRGEVVALGWWSTGLLTTSGLKSLILPTIALSLCQLTLIMRLVRVEMRRALASDYIRSAHARGLPRRSVTFGHAFANTLVPVINLCGLQVGVIIAFSIVTESVFQWPGMGLLLIESIQFVDVPVLAANLIVIAVVFVTLNLIVDILCYLVDPRLRDPAPVRP